VVEDKGAIEKNIHRPKDAIELEIHKRISV